MVETTKEVTTPTEAPTGTPQTPNEPIAKATSKKKINPRLLYALVAAVVLFLAGAVYYAYSQGSLPGVTPPTPTSNQATTTTPSVSSDVQSLDDTANQVQGDLNDVDSITNDINSIDSSNDQVPQL